MGLNDARRTSYKDWITEDGLIQLEGWAREGLIDADIAKHVGVNPSTLCQWKKAHPKIGKALKKGKALPDFKVENALYKAALGYSYDEITKEAVINPNTGLPVCGEDGEPLIATTKIVTKWIKPETSAQIFWLRNRRPDKWSNNPEKALGTQTPIIVDDVAMDDVTNE